MIRVKDGGGGMAGSFRLPGKEEFDHPVHLIFARKKTKEVKAHPELYKILEKTSPFDYVDLENRLFYPMSFRVVRFAIAEDSCECIITNLPKEEFPMEEIKKLYAMRWGMETSYREQNMPLD